MPRAAGAPLRLLNTLGGRFREFVPLEPGAARMYSCGPTVYAYQHVGNLRAYVFADTLRRALEWKGHEVVQVISITDVGHLTSDMDEGDDKLELASDESIARCGTLRRITPKSSCGRSSPSAAGKHRPGQP
jgi:cysteinyl-tRNA synthetase